MVKTSHPVRLASLDVFRGIAIACMIIVNNPGSWQHAYPFLRHAGWTGCALADLVFPFFLFIVGASSAFSFSKHARSAQGIPNRVIGRIIRRSLMLFLLGVFLNAFPKIFLWLAYGTSPDFAGLRIMGILQRISLIYLATALAVLYFSMSALTMLTLAILVGYWGLLMLVPVPGGIAGDLSPEGNLALYIDRIFLSASHMYGNGHVDPEGLFSTIPALATSLAGFFTGRFMRCRPKKTKTSIAIFLSGMCLLAAGYLWGLVFPLCKDLWTSSYVLVTAGWALLLMAACYELFEVQRLHSPGWPFRIMGRNSIFLFVASAIIARMLLNTKITVASGKVNLWFWVYDTFFVSFLGSNDFSSLAFTLAYLFLFWLVLYYLYCKQWFIKI